MAGKDERSRDGSKGFKIEAVWLGNCRTTKTPIACSSTSSSTSRRNKKPQMHALFPAETNLALLQPSDYIPKGCSACTRTRTDPRPGPYLVHNALLTVTHTRSANTTSKHLPLRDASPLAIHFPPSILAVLKQQY